jgi:N-acetylglucosaminyldiphosphoundecaprenol N-acetyl-beta-D-mannosaminyltransferase
MAKEKNKKIFLLGGYEESNTQAIEKLREKYNIEIDGFSPEYKPYPFEETHNNNILKRIEEFKPDILFVGFGAIKQEYWINDNKSFLEKMGIRWVVGSGGTFEFVANTIKRAPIWIQNIGLEGFYRMLKEPNMARVKRILLSFKIFKYVK